MIAAFAALALACAPNIHPDTLSALIRHESRGSPYAIGVNQKRRHLPQQPQTLATATAAADRLIKQGIDFDAGLGQINVRNWAALNLNSKTVFDPCRNLAAAQTVLADCYARALHEHQDPQQALRAALSCYNTGNFTGGFRNGYVGKILAQANIKVPALTPQASDETPSTPDSKAAPEPPAAEPHTPGTQDGFTANPANDGFSEKAQHQSLAEPTTNT
ncbi:lytic transglycosylase domain-containing protein [Bordetella tumulicola]|uniref:lytic transglycosylase domain-containing protein n=1 Tax=Bordetella tumulicola TaxID=1649133 RepID=UPI0039EEDA79